MENKRIFIIGDIHGCLDMLKRLLDKIQWQPESDELIFLGDYIDRGPDPKGVVDYILSLSGEDSARIQCLIGNHEAIFMDYIKGKDRKLFLLNGGMNTLESYAFHKVENEEDLLPAEHKAFFNSLKAMVELDEYYVVHAGFRPGVEIDKQELDDMLWIRDPFIYSDYDFGKKVIFGHTPFYEPLIMENKIGIDTGAVYGNRLTCLELPEFRFHSVEA
ncbi:MAG: serine/threonine protein phosphatase [Deltaproteobacteria bacterium]|nr:serine/threonine protein phosphatase [Deltaproteobacteria bacterium]MBW1930230.1 serine/threonine protein phosphatase [Deltaproteobacteria bacterium]MBW2024293.1 serine/threonine protein phosphatase [Deltaproteobacteria bacterium]MBW2125318.1 serine/threonine protein phosphatase [Deltaproteobacteria bacterium]RLB18822.1 MAG: serine/threonine protein phosphatase [Deltaproteobacteria bacterium]